MAETEFEMPVEVMACPVHGEVVISFGPMNMGDVANLIDYIKHSSTFKDELLDHVADTLNRGGSCGTTDV